MTRNWKKLLAEISDERLYLAYESLHAAAFGTILPLFAVYFRFAGLDLFDIALLAFIFEGTILLLEVPTGTAADLFGKVRTLRLASLVLAAAGVAFICSRSLGWFILAEVLCGIGEACRSGTADAWISVKFQKDGRDDDLSRLFARREKYRFALSFLGLLAGGLIGSYWLAAGWALFALLSLAALAVALRMVEIVSTVVDGFRVSPTLFVAHAREGLRHIFADQQLIAVLLLVLAANAAYEGVDQYWQVFLRETHQVAVIWFGLVTAAGALILFLVAERLVPRLYGDLGLAKSVYLLGGITALGLVVFALFPGWGLLLLVFLLFSVSRSLQEPLLLTYITQNSPQNTRATILSTQNLVSSGGEMGAALVLGLTAAAVGLRPVFLAGVLLIGAGLFLFSRFFSSDPTHSR